MALQPRRRQVVFGGTGVEGSSESDSGGAGGRAAGGVGLGASEFFKKLPLVAIGLGGGGTSSGTSDDEGGLGFGVSSTVE